MPAQWSGGGRFRGPKRIVQTPAAIVILTKNLPSRVIHTHTAARSKPIPRQIGPDIQWAPGKGDTLVVESNGFNDKTWTSRYGITHTDKLRVTERYRRADFGHLHVEVTYTDPGRVQRGLTG